ncbi:CgeB family protein [Pedobacter cryoconitis]|uniref:Lipopolysaccharide biosynthesis protein n=1 Tax=Pedobacter cryoconitis TaxID=188932 RepID=A0A327SYX3_9SPHI|nr:lipopolysaccharide biosynthesis protein [Pedobacter cryoconitis]RAJ33455.1 hypothetical protein LY11_01504 [Pedobacter cryoconitis]
MIITEKLRGKKILLLSVQTFNYEKIIADKLRVLGANVDYYDERPSNSLFAKGIIRLKRSFYQKRIDKYYRRILKDAITINYNYLFVIRGEVVPEFFLQEFRNDHPDCIFLFYTWDSFANHTHPISIQKYFDKRFTFDSNDAKKYDLFFRPLFFMDEYKELSKERRVKAIYDVLFLGTAHSDRYKIGNEIMEWCISNHLTGLAYYYMQGRLVFLYKKFFDKTFQRFDIKKISFKSLDAKDIIELYRQSSVILDINHPGQNGLTMRTFEALGAGKKLITTNSKIAEFPFYDPNNIMIINRENPILNKDFFNIPFVEISDELLHKMSIIGWFESIFIESEPNYWLQGFK